MGQVRHVAREVVGVGVEQGEVRERVDEPGQRRRAQAEAVEVDGRHGEHARRVRRVVAVEALVVGGAVEEAVAELRARPRRRHAQRVARDRLLERLDHRVQRPQLLVKEPPWRRRRLAPAPLQRRRRAVPAVPGRRRRWRTAGPAARDGPREIDMARLAERAVRRGEHEHSYYRCCRPRH